MKTNMGLFLAMALLLSSCNMPTTVTPDPQIATAAALTVQAVLEATTPFASPTLPNLPAGTTGTASTATQAVSTPTYSQPMASVEDVTNCRKGPATSYERVTQIMPLESVKIIGFFPPNYWIVSTKDGECWLSGEFTTPSGSFALVPTVPAPPTPLGGAPDAATFTKNGWTFYCYSGQADITLSWNDKADNESGYRIVRNSEVVAELPVNSTSFAETIPLLIGQSVEYKIRAYNQAGEADTSVSITCQ